MLKVIDANGRLKTNELGIADPVTVPHGGTGDVTLTNHGVLLGQGAAAVAATSAGTSGQPLLSGGASADSNWGTLSAIFGGTGQTVYTVGDLLYASTTTALSKLAAGTAGLALVSAGAGVAPSWSTVSASGVDGVDLYETTRKKWFFHYDDLATVAARIFGFTGINVSGTGSNVLDSTTSRQRRTTAGADDNSAGWTNDTLGQIGHFYHLPDVIFNIFTGSTITSCQIWVGMFDSLTPSVNPGTSNPGVNVGKHAAFRYAPNGGAGDSTWVASVGDGTTQGTAVMGAIAVSTQYRLRIRFTSNLNVNFSINGGVETTVTLATNAADATLMGWSVQVFDDGAVTRFIDLASVCGSYN